MGILRSSLPSAAARQLVLVQRDISSEVMKGDADASDDGLGFSRGFFIAMVCSLVFFAIVVLVGWGAWHLAASELIHELRK
jgi:hypothetical protein